MLGAVTAESGYDSHGGGRAGFDFPLDQMADFLFQTAEMMGIITLGPIDFRVGHTRWRQLAGFSHVALATDPAILIQS